jgi:hypothetical protein
VTHESDERREGPGTQAPPRTAEEALARAAAHGRRAAAEALLAARALLDALSLSLHGTAAEERRVLGLAARSLDGVAAALHGGSAPSALLEAVAEALDTEIARWEARARHDADARAVLRAWLGLREILWELGVRPARGDARQAPEAPRGTGPRAPGRRGPGPGRRVQRVPVEG